MTNYLVKCCFNRNIWYFNELSTVQDKLIEINKINLEGISRKVEYNKAPSPGCNIEI